jgi:UDP-glucose/GDP-mannose dehydrogenase family protein
VSLRILESVEAVNENRKRAMARKVSAIFGGALRGKTVGVLGLSFKPNTDDMREAPSLALITALQDMGARVRAFDPSGAAQARSLLDDVTYMDSAYDCADGADALVIATEWEQFRALDLGRLQDLMACPVIVDHRNIYRPEEMGQRGFAYVGVGRAPRRRCSAARHPRAARVSKVPARPFTTTSRRNLPADRRSRWDAKPCRCASRTAGIKVGANECSRGRRCAQHYPALPHVHGR